GAAVRRGGGARAFVADGGHQPGLLSVLCSALCAHARDDGPDGHARPLAARHARRAVTDALNGRQQMSGLVGLNKAPNGVVIGLVQLQLPVTATPADLKRQTEKIVAMVGKAKRGMPTMDLVVFPEYA